MRKGNEWRRDLHDLLKARCIDQLHVLIDLEERPAASFAIKIGDTMDQDMLKNNRTGGGGKGEGEEEGRRSVQRCVCVWKRGEVRLKKDVPDCVLGTIVLCSTIEILLMLWSILAIPTTVHSQPDKQ